ncbi:MAG TPA: serine/threonine-protein kinase, partial [Pirellulaceae bacterium]|nr:serine/threonine-protein kinase [Pirellulaceae bacterium]
MTSLGGRLLDGLTDEAAFEVDRLCDEVDAWSSEPQPPSFAEFRSRLSQSLGKLAEQFPSQPGARQAALFFIVSTIARTYLANGAWSVATASDLETVCGDETERSLFRQAVDEAVADAAASRSSSSSASATSQTLKRIGQYELIETLGAGGMGVVFKGRDPHSHRVVAIKVMRSDLAGDEESRERFRREARALQRLDHPGIVRQFREGVDDGRPYLVMEYVDGGSLQERAADAPLEPIVAAELLADVCDAAEYLHREGLIHRDVKPQNILLTSSGQAKLADFGLAKHLHATSMLTNTGQAIG